MDITQNAPLNILMVCRPSPKKNIIFAINLVKKLNIGKFKFRLYIYGKDNSRYSNEINTCILENNLYGEQVFFEGFVSDIDKAKIYSRFNLFLVPSLEENFCIAAAEAMHAGIPVIATRNVNITEYYFGDLLELIPNDYSYTSWSNILNKIHDDRKLLGILSVLSKKLAITKFTWVAYINSLDTLYKNLFLGK